MFLLLCQGLHSPNPYPNNVEVGVSSTAQGGQGGLKDSPGGGLAAARTAHDHGGVAGVLGFIQLEDLGEGEWCDLQAHISNFMFDGLPQLREGEIQEVENKGEACKGLSNLANTLEDNVQTI